jgi:ferredoxin-NADP reductase
MEATVTVRAVRSVGPNAVALELATPEGFTALPGQFVLVRATVDGEEIGRHYTLSSPTVGDRFELTVGVDPDGDLSPWLADRSAGDELDVEGPFGDVDYDDDGDVVVLAGGPGVGPAIGIAERARERDHAAAVVYRDDDPIHEDRLAALASDGADVAVLGDDASLDAAVARVVDAGSTYVFGFRAFVDDALAAVEAAGDDPDGAAVENFG